MPSFLTKQRRDAAIAVSWILVTEFHNAVQEALRLRTLLLWTIPVAGTQNLQNMADLPACFQSFFNSFECRDQKQQF
jgi:hypothetical protein